MSYVSSSALKVLCPLSLGEPLPDYSNLSYISAFTLEMYLTIVKSQFNFHSTFYAYHPIYSQAFFCIVAGMTWSGLIKIRYYKTEGYHPDAFSTAELNVIMMPLK